MRTRPLVLALAALLPSRAFPQANRPPTAKPPFVFERDEHFAFRAVEDDQGGFFLLWTRGAEHAPRQLLGQHLNAAGQSRWPKDHALASSVETYADWDAYSDGQGGLIVAWLEG